MALHKFTPLDRSPYRYWIGIDTGVLTGYAEWDKSTQQLDYVGSVPIHTAMNFLQDARLNRSGRFYVRVEDARLRKWIPRMPTASRERGRSEGAGSVKRDAKIWEDFLMDLNIDFELVAPKANKTKMQAETFRKLTGYRPITSSHGRDAAMLVYGY